MYILVSIVVSFPGSLPLTSLDRQCYLIPTHPWEQGYIHCTCTKGLSSLFPGHLRKGGEGR